MTKIAEAFQNKKAFIGFLTAGDPSLECTEKFIIKMEEAGAALIEIGIPTFVHCLIQMAAQQIKYLRW